MNENMKLMLNEKPLKMLFRLGVPAILIALFDEINGVIDTIFLGQFVASEAVSAMSVTIPFLLIISAISLLFTEGAGIAISRYLGGENIKQANKVFNNTLFLSELMIVFNIFSKDKKEKLDKGLSKTKDSVFSKLSRAVAGKSKVDDEVLDNLEERLVTSDVGVDTTLKIIERIENRVANDKYLGTSELNRILKEEIAELF